MSHWFLTQLPRHSILAYINCVLIAHSSEIGVFKANYHHQHQTLLQHFHPIPNIFFFLNLSLGLLLLFASVSMCKIYTHCVLRYYICLLIRVINKPASNKRAHIHGSHAIQNAYRFVDVKFYFTGSNFHLQFSTVLDTDCLARNKFISFYVCALN